MVKAEQWGLKEMTKSGADKAWGQECMVPHWVRGGEDKATAYISTTDKKGIALDVVALGNSIGTGAAPLRADVVEVKSFTDLESLKGGPKIVGYLYLMGVPNFKTLDGFPQRADVLYVDRNFAFNDDDIKDYCRVKDIRRTI